MGWKVVAVAEQRFRLVKEMRRGEWSVAELCRQQGISRPTAYKWLERFDAEGLKGLQDRSRAPHHCARLIEEETEKLILAVKCEHPYWGARKIKAHLEAQYHQSYPAASTIGDVLHRHGLTVARPHRAHRDPQTEPLAHADGPNRVWSVDFKGWFQTGDGRVCYPLTLTDNYSRYLLRCQGLPVESTLYAKPVLEAAFREYGLPERIRSDNGAPFGSHGGSGLTALTVWWIRLGIQPEHIWPGCPQQNGRHERMHKTLKQETASPPQATLRRQQERFDAFREEYNHLRPHQALGQKPPAQLYAYSPRLFPRRLPELVYPEDWIKRKVDSSGKFFGGGGHKPFVSHALAGLWIGLEPLPDDSCRAWFGNWELGTLDLVQGRLYTPGQWRRRQAQQALRVRRRTAAEPPVVPLASSPGGVSPPEDNPDEESE